jgi:hypothetical protein
MTDIYTLNEKQERFRSHTRTVAKMARVVMKELLKDPDPAWRELAKDWEDEFRRLQVDLEDMDKDFCEECGEEKGKCLCMEDPCCPTCHRDVESCECKESRPVSLDSAATL